VGSVIRLGAYDKAAAQEFLRGTNRPPNGPVVAERVVGVVRGPVDLYTNQVMPGVTYESQYNITFTPAFVSAYGDRVASTGITLAFRLKGGLARFGSFNDAVAKVTGGQAAVQPGSDDLTAAGLARHATRLEALALLLFGILAAVLALAMAAQALGRTVQLDAVDGPTLRAIGMTRAQLVAVAAIRAAVVGGLGAAGAVVVAFLVSPHMPIGLARQAEVHPGYSVDGALSLGASAVIITALTAWAAFARWRALRPGHVEDRPSRLADALNRAGAPASASLGIRMALEPGRGVTAVPARMVLISAVVAIGTVVATITFGANLTRLANQPRIQGWNWDVSVGNPHSDDISQQAIPLLQRNPDVSAFSALAGGGGPAGVAVDGHLLPAVFGIAAVKGAVLPPVISGHVPRSTDEIAFGAKSLQTIHRHVGQRVSVTAGGSRHKMTISGAMILTPSVVNDSVPLGQGALETMDGLTALLADAPPDNATPPASAVNVFLLRFSPFVDRAAAMARLNADFPGSVLPARRPSDVESLRRVDSLPTLLAVLFALVALVTVGHTLVSTVRRRRHDLAVLRTLGFVRGQVSATVAWQAITVGIVGLAVGLPVGVAAGRWAWTLVDHQLGLPPRPIVPLLLVLLLIPLSLVAANLAAAGPGWLAARTKPAAILRAE
jgi:hypothetical protein